MGGLTQQVNLYRPESARPPVNRSTRLLLLVGIVSALGVVLLAGIGEYHLRSVQAQRDAVAADLAAQRDAVARLRGQLQAPPVDPFLEAELTALRKRQRHLNDNLLAIARSRVDVAQGFSAFFAGLARNPVEGLWFSNVGLLSGGSEVLLKGRTTQPALVPRLLQTLAAEQAFAGRTFRTVNFERRDDAGVVEFELRSAHPGEDGDAG